MTHITPKQGPGTKNRQPTLNVGMKRHSYDDATLRAIARAVKRTRKSQGLTQRETHARLNDLYPYSFTSYRCLEAPSNNTSTRPVRLNQDLVNVLAIVLNVPRTVLATDREYGTLPMHPYRKAQRESKDAAKVTGAPVRDAVTSAQRLKAFMQQYGYSTRGFVSALNFAGYRIGETKLRSLYRDRPYYLTRELVDTAAYVFSRPPETESFDIARILFCLPNCPHCEPWLITA